MEIQDELIWRQCGFDSAQSHQSIHRFFTDFSIVGEDAFQHLVEQVADRELLDNIFRIDSTDIQADSADNDLTWNYDPTADSDDTEDEETEENHENDTESEDDQHEDNGGYYYGYSCVIVSTGQKIPVAAAFTQKKQIDEETARCVTRSPSNTRCGWSVMQPSTCLADTTTSSKRSSCQWLRTIHETPMIHSTSSTESKIVSKNTGGRAAEAINVGRDVRPPNKGRTNNRCQ